MLQITSGRTTRVAVLSAVLAVVALLIHVGAAGVAGAQAGKIRWGPFPTEVDEGSSVVVEIQLAQPLISPGDPAYLTISYVSEDPDRLTVSPTSVTWAASEWSQTRTVTVEALADGVHNATDSVTLVAEVETNAPYYFGAPATMTIGIRDMDPEPTTTAPPATTAPTTIVPSTVATPASRDEAPSVASGSGGGSDGGSGRSSSAPVAELALTGARRTSPTLALVGAVSVLSGAMMLRTSRRRRVG